MRAVLILIVAMLSTAPAALLSVTGAGAEAGAEQRPSTRAGTGGYITRFNAQGMYETDEEVIVLLQAFRAQGDRPVNEGINVRIERGLQDPDRQLHGGYIKTELVRNFTLDGPGMEKCQTGQWPMGTYLIKAVFMFPDGAEISREETVLISHSPMQYSLVFLGGGRKLHFHSEDNSSFQVEIFFDRGREKEIWRAFPETQELDLDLPISREILSVTVEVTDNYNWTNAENGGNPHFYVYADLERGWDFYLPLLITWIIIASFIVGIILIIWSVVKKRRQNVENTN